MTKVECGSPESNFKVAATVETSEQCPADVDSYYSMRGTFSDKVTTICMDIDWVVGNCMSIDPNNDKDPLQVDCNDTSVPNRQRATQILERRQRRPVRQRCRLSLRRAQLHRVCGGRDLRDSRISDGFRCRTCCNVGWRSSTAGYGSNDLGAALAVP